MIVGSIVSRPTDGRRYKKAPDMRLLSMPGCLALVSLALAACGPAETPDAAPEDTQATAREAGTEQITPPYKPVASVADLMRGLITLEAETYWQSVSVVVDADGVHENMPETDEEWIEVWAAGMALAESGNLLMMPPRAKDEEAWMQYSEDLVDAGVAAAEAALDRDFEGVLAEGETIYNACIACHRDYVPRLPDL